MVACGQQSTLIALNALFNLPLGDHRNPAFHVPGVSPIFHVASALPEAHRLHGGPWELDAPHQAPLRLY